ncbi:MAG: hypothetical protein E7411_05735 [Ruminococcaceae bacterium]|nr:hypothetical protein [Oscillospiraceae bacterium]
MAIPKLSELTLREKIGQTCIFHHQDLMKLDNPKEYFKNNPIGADWVSTEPKEVYKVIETELGNPELNGKKEDMFINFVNYINKCMKIPLLPALDAAQGIPQNKFEGHAALPTGTGLGATRDPELAYRYARCLGDDIHSIGFRWVWSPVADNSQKGADLRQLTSDTEINCKMLTAFIKGMQSAGVATGAKHFPGQDPDETRDFHFSTASYRGSLEEWENTQGREFMACIEAGVDSIMVGHTTFKAVDDTLVNGALLPCSLSYKVVTELIKGKLGFSGVCLTDDSAMKAMQTIYPRRQMYVEAIKAGIDMIINPQDLDYIDILENSVLSGELSEDRIDDACLRILKLKEKYGIFIDEEVPHPTEEKVKEISDNIHRVTREITEKGLTLAANRTNFVPVDRNKIKKVKIFYIGYSQLCCEKVEKYIIPAFEKYGAKAEFQVGYTPEDDDTLNNYDLIVYATYIGFHAPAGAPYFFGKEIFMISRIMRKCVEKSVGISFGDVNIFYNYFTAAHTFVNCYSYTEEAIEGFVRGLYGDLKFIDYSPFPLNPVTKTNDVY